MVPAGTVAGHVLGYLMAGEDAGLHGAHSHLRPAAWVAAGLTAAALAAVAVARPTPTPTTGRGRGRPRVSWLVAGQVLAFGLLEAAEHLGSGHGALSFVADPSFRWGVAAQLVSAALLIAAAGLARTSGQRVRALLARRPVARRRAVRRSWPALRAEVRRPSSSWSAVSERGPPRLLAPA